MTSNKTLFWFLLGMLFLAFPLAVDCSVQAQSSQGQVGLVVQFLDGRLEKKCVEITKDPFMGYDVLISSGYKVEADFSGSLGAAICMIDQDGCSMDNCFCDKTNYWAYYHLGKDDHGDTAWLYSQFGASNYSVHPGDVEGWRYGNGIAPSTMPAFEEICSPSTPTATETSISASPTKTAHPISNPTATSYINPSSNIIIVPNITPSPTKTIVPASPTSTFGPLTNNSQVAPTPTASVTQTLVATATSTSVPPTEPPVPVSTHIPAQFIPTFSPEPQTLNQTSTYAADSNPATQPVALEPAAVAFPASAPEPAKTSIPAKARAKSKQATKLAKATSIAEIGMTTPQAVNQAQDGPPENQQAPTTRRGNPKWLLILGSFTGFASFMVLFALLVAGLLVVYLQRRK